MNMEQQTNELSFNNYADFFTALQKKDFPLFPAAHRGLWKTVPENSLSAFQQCFDHGIFLIELDLQRTKDGHLIVMHDTTVDRMTNGSGKISELALSEIRSLSLKEDNGGEDAALTNEQIPTFTEVLHLIDGKAMVNIDKAWQYRHQLYESIDEMELFDYVLLKSREPVEAVAEFLDSKQKRMQYMHKLDDENLECLDELLEKVSPIAVEVIFQTESDQVISKSVLAKLRKQTNIWCNSLDIAENAGHTDSLSLTEPDKGWGWLIDKGVNIIQTNYPVELINYAQRRNFK